MAQSNVKKSINNMASTILYQILTLALGIVIPRLVIVSLGSESNGLLNSVNQALTYLALLEGGIGLTITKALYGPVATDDRDEINGIISAANLFFKKVGVAYFFGVVLISIVFPLTIQTTLPPFTVFAVVVLTAMPAVINFFFQQKYRILISIYGKNYVLTNLTTVTYVWSSVIKITLLLNGFGLIAVQMLYFCIQLAQMLFISWYIRRLCPWLNIKAQPLKNKIGQRSAVFLHQIASFVFSSTDMLILTYFCNLKVVSVYSIYAMLFSAVKGLGQNFVTSFTFAMGQKFHTDFEEYKKLHNITETCNMVINFALFLVLYNCILPFLKLYTAGISDILYVDTLLPVLFVSISLLEAGRYPSQKAIEFAGEFQNTRSHALLEAIVNLVVSIVGVQIVGIYGVLLGTIAALLVRNILMINFAFKKILNMSPLRYVKKWTINLAVFIVLASVASVLTSTMEFSSYISLVLFAVVLGIVALAAFSGVAYIYDRAAVSYIVRFMRNKLLRR